ncbi:hypothetical protein [Actinomyces minihominis]|uniref:hypothetical protein n=1 Tax=Actinomyces minihominis TaxID=2002838 RepID=UPI000C074809|nr:hypothetical protein [Actinomyces minihominis]
MKNFRTSAVAILSVSVLGLAACSSGGGSQSGDSTSSPYEMGPLDEYLSVMWEGEEWTQEDYDAQHVKREELIAECMAKEGFEYIPDTNNGPTFWSSEDFEEIDWNSIEYAEKYGYGVVDWPGREEMETSSETVEEYIDPNQDYLDSLSESELNTYYEVLWGTPTIVEPMEGDGTEEMEYEYNWEENGCYGWADHETNADNAAMNIWEDPEFADLLEQTGELWNTAEQDPEMVAARGEWAACMNEAGYSEYNTPDEAQQAMYDEQSKIYEDAATTDGEWVEPPQALWDELQEREIALATADRKCAIKVKLTERSQKVNHRLQQEFLDAHKAELDAMIAKVTQSSKN